MICDLHARLSDNLNPRATEQKMHFNVSALNEHIKSMGSWTMRDISKQAETKDKAILLLCFHILLQ